MKNLFLENNPFSLVFYPYDVFSVFPDLNEQIMVISFEVHFPKNGTSMRQIAFLKTKRSVHEHGPREKQNEAAGTHLRFNRFSSARDLFTRRERKTMQPHC